MTRNVGDLSEELKALLRRIEEIDEPKQRLPLSDQSDQPKSLIARPDVTLQPHGEQAGREASGKSRRLRLVGRMAVPVIVAAGVAVVLALRMPPIAIVVIRDGGGGSNSQTLLSAVRDRLDAEPRSQSPTNQIDVGANIKPTGSATVSAIDPEPAALPRPLLSLASQKVSLQSDQVWPLGLHTTTEGDGGALVVNGLAAGTKLSVGRPSDANGWELNAGELNGAVIIPPSGYVGTMDLTIELRLNGTTIDQRSMQIEWQVPTVRLAPGAITRQFGRGEKLLASGEIAAARRVFKYLADHGEARAAIALAETYEKSTLQRLGARGIKPDIVMARTWHEKARELGSTEAQRRLDVLEGPNR